MLALESSANRPGPMKKKTFYFSIPFYEVNRIIWMDAKSVYLTYRILIYWIKVEFGENKIWGKSRYLDFHKSLRKASSKLSLEKIKFWGESRYLDFHKSLRKASSSTKKKRGLLYNFFHNWFFVAEE